jgi:hypothetical protein
MIGSNRCSGSRITSLDPQRGAPGEEFTIHGVKLENFGGPDPVPPRMKRCEEFTLEVVQWFENDVRGRIPPNVPAGVYDVWAFGRPPGAYTRPRTNSLPFWVTAASVPASVTDAYEVQVKAVRTRYGRSAEWEAWMLANRPRYQAVLAAAHALPCPLPIAVSYETPLAYSPPWSSETEHMTALDHMAEGAFPGYHFDFQFDLAPAAAYAHAILGLIANTSAASGRTVRLHYETIFNHEFGHVLNLPHHYDGIDTIGTGLHFPPGERGCLMDRNENQYCSACRTALNLPLDVDREGEIDAAAGAIVSRYPSGW